MLRTISTRATYGTRLRGISRVNIDHMDTRSLCLVCDKVLKLTERPAMQAGTHFASSLDVLADVRQVFHGNRGKTVLHRFSDNGLADFVIYMFDVPCFSAGDLCHKLPSVP